MLQLKAFNCTKCGGSLDFAADGLRAKCKYCGTEHFFKEDKAEALIMLLNEAGEYLKRNLFDDAITKYFFFDFIFYIVKAALCVRRLLLLRF